jgi:hypothetical protein
LSEHVAAFEREFYCNISDDDEETP